ncbi:MAG: ABC transporter permease [Spirochaetes bacterium]|uniref:ABC transporter permease n=1 Tax=Candidatus Ornithospirochaeta stercoripullorum TaxID=2840899 RepID=A0A9D9H669_9SPIO|nr:ABC transporter permease [Candidatus Ornithospirochaeta stercoripullorum]
MLKYVVKRLVLLIPVLIGVVTIVFILNQLMPGDPARMMAGDGAPEEAVEALREEMGLNRPLIVQYIDYIVGIFTRGDLGTSYKTGAPVLTEVIERMPTTLILAGISTLIAVGIGIPLGIAAATWQNTFIDYFSSCVSFIGVSMPNFWQGLMNILLFSVYLGWFPSSGFYGPEYWILPCLTVGTSTMATITRTTRSSMLEVIRQDYIRTARAKGMSEYNVIVKHALGNALIPIVTIVGLEFGSLLGGAVLTETVFAIPGIGKYMVDAITNRNYPVIMGGVVILAFIFSVCNLVIDVLYAYIDPRMKSQYKTKKKKKEAEE